MNKFVKDFKTFVNETYTGTAGSIQNNIDSLPQEVIETTESILDGNFDHAADKRYDGNIVRFNVTKMDYDLEQPDRLEVDLGMGASRKRKYDVVLNYVDKQPLPELDKNAKWKRMMTKEIKEENSELTKKEIDKRIGDIWSKLSEEERSSILNDEIYGELTYEIDFKLKTSRDKFQKAKEEEIEDTWEKPEEDDELVETPEEDIVKKPGRKKIHLDDIDTFFRGSQE